MAPARGRTAGVPGLTVVPPVARGALAGGIRGEQGPTIITHRWCLALEIVAISNDRTKTAILTSSTAHINGFSAVGTSEICRAVACVLVTASGSAYASIATWERHRQTGIPSSTNQLLAVKVRLIVEIARAVMATIKIVNAPSMTVAILHLSHTFISESCYPELAVSSKAAIITYAHVAVSRVAIAMATHIAGLVGAGI